MQVLDPLWHAVHQWLRRPLLAALAVVPLALAIAALTALFTLINVTLLRPLPGILAADGLVEIERAGDGGMSTMSYLDFVDLAAQTQSLEHVYAWSVSPLSVRAADAANASNSFGMLVSASYFDALRVRAHSGRLLQARDMARDGQTPAAVVSYSAWQRLFGANSEVLGQTVTINGAAFVLVGIAAAEFNGHIAGIAPDFYLPLTQRPVVRPARDNLLDNRLASWLLTGGRIADAHDLDSVRAELATIGQRLSAQRSAERPDPRNALQLSATPLHPLPRPAMQALLMFAGILGVMIAMLLLVACVNVAGLALARAEERRTELAVRLSLGASHAQLALMMLADALVLALTATALGVALAWVALKLLLAVQLPIPIPFHLDIALDLRVVAFAATLALLTALACGLIPAWRAARSPLAGQLHRFRSQRARNLLSVVQIAATLVLLVNGGAILRTMQQLEAIDPGMRVDGVLTLEFDLETSGYRDEQSMPMAAQLLEAARQLPGVDHAALAAVVPLTLSSMSLGSINGPGLPEEGLYPDTNVVSPGYVTTLGIRLRGRDFDARDRADSAPVVIINQHLARQVFGDADPIGRSFSYGDGEDRRSLQVIGVVDDGNYASIGESQRGYLLLAHAQHPRASMNLMLRSDMQPATAAAAFRTVLTRLDPNLPPPQVFRLADMAAISMLPQRIASAVVSALGGLGLLLVALGLYGLLAQFVQSHLREIGVRLALGAAPAQIARDIRWRGLRLVLIGLAIAILPALGVLKLVSSVIVGVQPFDVPVLLGAIVAVLAISVATCQAPARRAASTAPSVALRHA
ncbi:MAG TPA: ADOP family duplicated permease [Xanthomonadales bacterium]|nr:ADOP family duplicated permease [Xanthomonadales bacterium]